MSTPSSPRTSSESTSSYRVLSTVLGVLAVAATIAAVWIIVVIATTEVSLGTLASALVVVAFFAAVGWFVLRRNFFHRS